MTTILAPTISAPRSSLTVPAMRPVVCAKTENAKSKTGAIVLTLIIGFHFENLELLIRHSRPPRHFRKSRVGANRVEFLLVVHIQQSALAFFEGFVEPDESLLFIAELGVKPRDIKCRNILAATHLLV